MAFFNLLTCWGFESLWLCILCVLCLSCPNVANGHLANLEQQQLCPTNCPVSDSTCDFYTCLEARHDCGPDGYPLAYGFKYCEAFNAETHKFTEQGQIWILRVRLCLQQALPTTVNCQTSCAQIESDAFASHAACYVDNGLCELRLSDWIALVEVVGVPTLKLIAPELENVLQVAERCVGVWTYLSGIL